MGGGKEKLQLQKGKYRPTEIYSETPLIRTPIGEESVLIRAVSLFQGLNCMQELFLVKEKVSILKRCLHFIGCPKRGVPL